MNKKTIVIGLLLLSLLVGGLAAYRFLYSQDQKDYLRVVTSTPAIDLSPYSLNRNDLTRTANLYQGLVAFDANLKVIPSLAISWGAITPTTWEFKLRNGVLFHDGSPFSAESVVTAFEALRAQNNPQAEFLKNSLQEVKITDANTVRIITPTPDPLILSKLTKFLIAKPNYTGTGPYKYREWLPGVKLSLTRFEDYWGRRAAYQNVDYVVTEDRTTRRRDFENGLTDILAAVPPDQALELPQEQLRTHYSLEVNFLMFKLDDPILADPKIREAIGTIFDPARIEAIGNNFIRQASQFVAPGVYGYNADLPVFRYDADKAAKNLFGNRLERLTIDFLPTYETLVDYLVLALRDAGFSVRKNPLSEAELLAKIQKNESQIFLVGWQSENGDAGDFLDAFIYSQGQFNKGRYQNEDVDRLIEQARRELDPEKRLNLLKTIMTNVQNDVIGVPLFESANLYAVQKDVIWNPRLDGLVLAADVL